MANRNSAAAQASNVTDWAQSFMGTQMRIRAHAYTDMPHHTVVSYRPCEKGKGYWFILDNGSKVYRETPKRFR